jgi:hypothetical protein
MEPRSLTAASFQAYAPLARGLACQHLDLLRDLPLVLCAVLLREIINFDFRFPRERAAIEARLAFLEALPQGERRSLTRGFADLSLSPDLLAADWVRSPQRFEENLSAYLWASKQHDQFRDTAVVFAQQVDKAIPPWNPGASRWVVVVLGPDLRKDGYPLFRKLRPQGVFFPRVTGDAGMTAVLGELDRRAAEAQSHPYDHWYIDGGSSEEKLSGSVCQCSWAKSTALRAETLERIEKIVGSGSGGPEMLRSAMASWTPGSHSLATGNELVDRFVLSVYAEGSGTQVFSTTFVQWATREILRRAEPVNVVARYGLRQKQRTLNQMFSKTSTPVVPDPAGSLVDGDFGAYLSWVNLTRIGGGDQIRFIAWSEAHGQAVAIGPGWPRGTEAPDQIGVTQLLRS